ncbi:hypothetical protein H5Q13_19860 [Escherichia coli]|nr:hypothetical protein [Escherichia coli]
MMNIKKAAPKWSHLSEQLTRCAVCVNNHKPGHDNRDQAGGQLSCLLGPYCAAIFIRSEREYFFRNSSRTKAHGANLSDSCSSAIFSCSLFVFCDGVLVDSLLVIVCTCKAMRRSSSRHGADSNYSFDSMPRLSNSRRKSLFIHPERLSSPSSFMAMLKRSNKSASRRSCTENLSFLLSLVDIVYLEYNNGLTVTMYTNDTTKAKPAGAMNTNGLLTKPLIEVTIMAIKEHSLLFIHTQTPRKRNNPFHSSVLCTHPGGRFLPDLSRRGYLSTKSSRANFSGGTKRGAGGGIFVLVSSSSSLAQASDCLCRMISSSCVCVSCIGDSVLLVMILPCKAMRRNTSHHGADSFYPLGSIPRRFSSVRPNSLSQLARLTPSLLASLSNCSFSSGDIRIWNGGALPVPFGFLSRLITVDMCTPIALCFYSIGVHLNTRALKKAKPGCARTLTGLLTNNVN